MKTRTWLATAIIAALALSACRNDDADNMDVPVVDNTATPAEAPPTADTSPPAAAALDEKAALGLLNAINDHEIAAGRQAEGKGVTGEVAEFAALMIKEHSENREKTLALAPNDAHPEVAAQREKGEGELGTLAEQSGDAYAKAFMQAMVKGHTEALATLDSKLIPAATSEPVRQHFTDTRQHVAQHLEMATRIANAAPAQPAAPPATPQ